MQKCNADTVCVRVCVCLRKMWTQNTHVYACGVRIFEYVQIQWSVLYQQIESTVRPPTPTSIQWQSSSMSGHQSRLIDWLVQMIDRRIVFERRIRVSSELAGCILYFSEESRNQIDLDRLIFGTLIRFN